MSKTVKEKSVHYLIEGRVSVQACNSEMAIVKVQGSAAKPYTVTFSAHWDCDCEARVECAHIVAAKTILPLREKEHYEFPNTNSEITNMLNRYLN